MKRQSNIPELYNTVNINDYWLNINGVVYLVYEVSPGIAEIDDNLKSVISCRKQTQTEIADKKLFAQDMFNLHEKLERKDGKDGIIDYKDIWEIDISYKLLSEKELLLSDKLNKIDKYAVQNKTVLYFHGISTPKQIQSFYAGFVEMNDHLYCVTKEKCIEILRGRNLDLSRYLDIADDGDMIQIYSGCASNRVFVAVSFTIETDFRVKYKDVFTKIHYTKQNDFEKTIHTKKAKIENFLQTKIENFSQWKKLTTKEDLLQIFDENYKFNDTCFSCDTENGRRFGHVLSVSDLTAEVLSKGFL
jgi:hypothetical protein